MYANTSTRVRPTKPPAPEIKTSALYKKQLKQRALLYKKAMRLMQEEKKALS